MGPVDDLVAVHERRQETSRRPPVILLSGPSRAGKTTVCARVVELARAAGLSVGGVLTENVVTGAGAPAQYVRDIAGGERRLLATATPERERVRARLEGEGRPFGLEEFAASWVFDEDGVAFGNAVLVATLASPPDLLVVDQIGPLEFWGGAGFGVVFDVVGHGRSAALVAVHPLTLEQAKARFPGARHVLEVGPATRDALPGAIMALVEPVARG